MNLKTLSINLLLGALIFSTVSCFDLGFESDSTSFRLISFYDLRDRESFVQITNTDGFDSKVHVQIFDVANNCNENNFFDDFTGNDTHIYNMRDIQTNDGNPSGVVLPDNAYGMVVINKIFPPTPQEPLGFIGNFRVLDSSGYEYRTNSLGLQIVPPEIPAFGMELTLNFNKQGGVSLSDVIGFTIDQDDGEVFSADITNINVAFDVDILDLDENVFSCRNIIFACTDQDNPRLEELLAEVGSASVASFEYGINEAIPHSKGGELLCPGNNIDEGLVRMTSLPSETDAEGFGMFVGLNNNNGRGSMDSFWIENFIEELTFQP